MTGGMDGHTYEKYNENEYFIKFLQIHPYLHYSNNKYDLIKKKLQINLLKLLNENKINKEKIINIHKKIEQNENNNKNILCNLENLHKKVLLELSSDLENQLINDISHYIDKY